jgi:hypothetical protein
MKKRRHPMVAGDIGKILVFFGKYFDQKSAFFLPFFTWDSMGFFWKRNQNYFPKKTKILPISPATSDE